MAGKAIGKQFVRQAKGAGWQTRGTGGKECGRKRNGRQFARQAGGEHGRQGERETRSVVEDKSERLGETEAR